MNNNRKSSLGDGCRIYDWNYTQLSGMSYDEALSYTQSHDRPDSISCMDKQGSYYHYIQEPGTSIVLEAISKYFFCSRKYLMLLLL